MKIKYIILQIIIFFSLLHQVEAKNLYNDGTYVFTEKNAKEFLAFGQFLAGAEFTNQEKRDVKAYALADFKTSPKGGVSFYKSLSISIQEILSPNADPFARVQLFLYMHTKVKFAKSLKNHPGNFYKVIDRYNPPINEALALQQYYNNLMYYTLQTNQYYFNQMMNTYKQNTQHIIDTNRDFNTRQSISIAGNTIVAEYDNYFVVQNPKGNEYKVSK
ncbi:MAG: hypothetical protein KAH20_09520 [Methylococcales bacterium]|nr:hypothetical protein [Methylococcales bacterium]